jgi:hypothetical protein
MLILRRNYRQEGWPMRWILLAVLLCPACSGRTATVTLDGGDARGESTGKCFIDSPCPVGVRCLSATTYQPVKSDCDCAKYCNGTPCSGCTCVEDGPVQTCPSGQRCIGGAAGPCGYVEAGPGDRGTDKSQQKCFIDFPCRSYEKIHCLTATTFEPVQTDCDCMKYCPGAATCSGCVCVASGASQSCPAGQVCIKSYASGDHCDTPDGGVPKID